MFNLEVQLSKYRFIQSHKDIGIPEKPRQHDNPVQHISDDIYDKQAELECQAMANSYSSRTIDFGKRTHKNHCNDTVIKRRYVYKSLDIPVKRQPFRL